MRYHRKPVVAALSLSCLFGSTALAQDGPNLIFILTDDQGVESIEGPYWSNEMGCFTPTLSALAAQGVSFTNCRVNPNCSPTRACLMTGRLACETGVNGVLGRYVGDDPCTGDPLPYDQGRITNRLGLQHQEKTLAEVLHEKGYYTILIDKWHLGYNESQEDLGLLPLQQGFDEYFDWMKLISPEAVPRICLDEPLEVGDEHMVLMEQLALEAVARRGQDQKYALFYHTVTPHRRQKDGDNRFYDNGYHWWRVDEDLCPQSWIEFDETYEPNVAPDEGGNVIRFIQNVEAIDTVLQDLLIDLGVIADDANRTYNTGSDTIVFFTSDNGTDDAVSSYGADHAKNSTYEGGIKVPLFVMGEGITGGELQNTEDTRLVSHVDFYDTICDIVEATEAERNNDDDYGRFPRRGVTFADGIGWGDPPSDPREFSISSYGNRVFDNNTQEWIDIWRVIMVGERYKLVCNSGGAEFDDMSADEFYDLEADPQETAEPTVEQVTTYLDMRDRLVDFWPTAVADAHFANPAHFTVTSYISYGPMLTYALVAHIINDAGEFTYDYPQFYDEHNDPEHYNDLLLGEMFPFETGAFNALDEAMGEMVENGQAGPDVRVVDVPCDSYLIMTSESNVVTANLTIGHENVEAFDELEYRAKLTFDVTGAGLPGFEWSDLRSAQIVINLDHDSVEWHDEDYADNDTDTGVITIHQMTASTNNLFSDIYFSAAELGLYDPPPHIIPDPPSGIRGVPMPSGVPVSFGHNDALLSLVQGWRAQTTPNYGVLVKAERLGGFEPLPGDQHIHFLKEAFLRLTFDRQE